MVEAATLIPQQPGSEDKRTPYDGKVVQVATYSSFPSLSILIRVLPCIDINEELLSTPMGTFMQGSLAPYQIKSRAGCRQMIVNYGHQRPNTWNVKAVLLTKSTSLMA